MISLSVVRRKTKQGLTVWNDDKPLTLVPKTQITEQSGGEGGERSRGLEVAQENLGHGEEAVALTWLQSRYLCHKTFFFFLNPNTLEVARLKN